MRAGKDIENRTWNTRLRGWVLLHAGKNATVREFQDAGDFMVERGLSWKAIQPVDFPKGAILGAMLIDDVHHAETKPRSPWFVGPYGFHIANVRLFREPVPCKGALGFFEVPKIVAENPHVVLSVMASERWAA
jgi:hypothetical protein